MKRTFTIALAVTLGLFVAGTAIAARNSSGTYSLPNAPVQAGQTITSTWANTTLADIKSEITDSLSRSGKGGMTAPLRTADGSSSFPAWSWTSETGTGFYRAGTNDLRLVMGASDRMNVNSSTTSITGSTSSLTLNALGATVALDAADYFLVQLGGGNHFNVSTTAINAYSKPIQNVTDPSSAQDAATKNYVDAPATQTWTTLTVGGAGCSAGSRAPAYTRRSGIVFLRGDVTTSGAAQTCTLTQLPVGYRPGAVYSNVALTPAGSFTIATTGVWTFQASAGAGTVTIVGSFPAEG